MFFREAPAYLLDERLAKSGIGECRRHAPVLVSEVAMPIDPEGSDRQGCAFVSGIAAWPRVHPLLGGCGDFAEGPPHPFWHFPQSDGSGKG